MNNIKNVPEIRFKGYYDKDGNWIAFTHPWEQRKLGDEAEEILAGGDIDKEKAVDDGVYPIYANALTNDGIVGYYDDYYRVKAPAVTVTGRGEVGRARARMIDFTPVVRLLAVRSNHDCYFLENAINNHKVVVESTGVPQLTVPQLSSYDICFPKDIVEEKKIGTYFNHLDHLITLHQRKCDAYEKLKKCMLQKLLNQVLRFKADDGSDFPDWEERYIGELVTEYTEKTTQNNQFEVLSSTHDGIRFQKDYFNKKTASADTTGYKVVPRGYFTYRAMSDNNVFVFNRQMIIDKGIVSPAYPVFDVIGADKIFFEQCINNTNEIRKQLITLKEGGTRYALSFSKFCAMRVTIPSDNAEQQKIAKCLLSLDNVIENQKAKVAVLKKLKKCMLQKMFV